MSRVLIIVLCLLVLVGLMGVVTSGFVTSWDWAKNDADHLASSSKAVQAICQPTDYKLSCIKSLATVRTNDPKELVRAALNSAKSELTKVANHSPLLKNLEKDPQTAQAVKDCRELFQDAIDDFHRSLDEVGRFELNQDQVNDMLSNLKTWISATRTYQETCLDGFEKTTVGARAKVRKILRTSIEMSSNGLVISNELSSLFNSLNIGALNRRRMLSHPTINRRLLSSGTNGDSSILLEGVDEDTKQRRLLSTVPVLGHSSSEEIWPEWVDGYRRKLLTSFNLASDLKDKANVIVAQDGSGKYKTIEEAIKDIPKGRNESFIIYIKEGVYNEYIVLYKWMTNVVFIGDGPTKTRITNNKNFVDGTKTFKTATLSVLGDFFMAKDIGIENSAGAIKHQAVAFRAQSDKSIFFNCHFDGYQDTLYTHTYRQFYCDCKISGTIDFVFGDATAFFQNCTFIVRKPLENQNCIVTAQGRMERHQPTGIIIHKSKFEGDPDYLPLKDKNKAYLGRPWKEYSKTIIMESQIDELIQPDGWLPWEGDFGLETCYYGEYNNVGAGSSLANRVKWRGIKTIIPSRAETFMPPKLYENDDWITSSGIPYEPDLSSPPGPATGVDEDPNAPVGAPISVGDGSSHSSGTSSYSSKENGSQSSLGGSSSGLSASITLKPTNGSSDAPNTSQDHSSSASSSTPAPNNVKVSIGPVTVRELERILMKNEEIEEDDRATDDMSGNVPNGDEPSPARVEPPSPAPSASNIVVAPSPSEEEVTNSLPPAVALAPAPNDETEADNVPPTSPKPSSGIKSCSELHVVLTWTIMWVALFM